MSRTAQPPPGAGDDDQTLRDAYLALDRGDPARCAELLDGIDTRSPLGRSLLAVARGLEAETAGDPDAADALFDEAFASGIPLAALLRETGRYFKRRAAYARAYECFTLLDQLEPGAMAAFLENLPGEQRRRYAPWQIPRLALASRPLYYRLRETKVELVAAYGEEAAAMVLSESLGTRPGWQLKHLPLRSLKAYAEQHALRCTELIPAAPVAMTPPAVYGMAPQPPVPGRARAVFLCVLPDVVVSSKSNLLQVRDCLLLDYQNSELERIPINPDVNPEILAVRNGLLSVIDAEPERELPRGFSLVGLHSWAWGHWIVEFMFQVWVSMDQPDFEGVPLIVDEMMPPQLIELLRLFVGEDHPLIVLRPGERIRVRELLTCSKVVYWPGGEQRPDPELDFELSDSEALARVVARLQPLLETLPTDGLPERIYLTRKSGQGRQLENRGAVEALFRDRGFAVLDFNALPVREQLCHLRAARTVVMEAGSSIYGLLFCRPGTRIGELAGPPMEEYLWVADMCRSLGHRLLLFPFDGAFDPPASSPPAQLRADLASLPGFLEQLESGEASPARLQASPAGS